MKLLFLFFLIPFLLLTRVFIDINQIGYLTLDDRPSIGNLSTILNRELLKDATVSGQFQSGFDNLGIIGIRFETFNRINDDWLEFKIKEEGASEWYYTAKYKTDQFQPGKLFPFDFPQISDSKGKTYKFELRSINGWYGNAVAISKEPPNLIGRHVFSKKMFLDQPALIPYFLQQKAINLSEYSEFLKSVLLYSLPLIIIIIFSLTDFSILVGLTLIFGSIYWDIFVNTKFYDSVLFSGVFAWWLVVRRHRLAGKISALLSLGLFVLIIFLTLDRNYPGIEKATLWAILFLLFTFIAQLGEVLGKSVNANGIKFLWDKLRSETKTVIYSVNANGIKFLWEKIWPETKTVIYSINQFSWKGITTIGKTAVATNRLLTLLAPLLPIIAIVWLFGRIIEGVEGAITAYHNYFPSHQMWQFFTNTGVYLLFVYLVSGPIYLLLVKKYKAISKVVLFVLVLFFTYIIQSKIIRVTSFDNSPVVWKVRGYGLYEPWVDVFIDGRKFHDTPFRGKVLVNGVEQRIVGWTDHEIIFRTNPTTTKSGKLTVIRNDGAKSNQVYFEYYGNR